MKTESQSDLDLKPTKTTRIVNWFMMASLVIVALAVGIFLRWAFQSEEVIRVNNEPFPVRTIEGGAPPNSVIILTVDYCKLQDIEGRLRMSWLSESSEVLLPESTESLEKGCKKSEVPVIVPNDLEPGVYRVKFKVTYDINPLKRNIPDEFVSQSIEVK